MCALVTGVQTCALPILVFVDSMKELSATLLLRPIGFETLATWLYAEASRGTYEEGAVAALMIVLVGLLPVVLLARTGVRYGRGRMAVARRCWSSMARSDERRGGKGGVSKCKDRW